MFGWYEMARARGKYEAIGGHTAIEGMKPGCAICGRPLRYSSRSRTGVAHASTRRSHGIRHIPAVRDYMKRHHPEYADRPPIIFEACNADGWHRYPFSKRVSRTWLRKMLAEGYTWVGLSPDPQGIFVADFNIRELV